MPGETYLNAFYKDTLVLMTPVKRERENSGRCMLSAGETYVIIPSTEIAGKQNTFYLSVYFNQRLRDVNIKRIFHPQDTNSKKDEVLPQFIPEEAEKLVNQTPLWKIKLVKESLKHILTDYEKKELKPKAQK